MDNVLVYPGKTKAVFLENIGPPTTRKNYVIQPEAGHYSITGHGVGMHVEGPPESVEGRRVDSRPASGGRACSNTDATGAFTAEISGSLVLGRAGEQRVLDVLIHALRERGKDVTVLLGSRDDRGEDGLLNIDGRSVRIQVVSVPVDRDIWQTLATQGCVLRGGTAEDAVGLIRAALVHKKTKAQGTLLALDAAHLGAIVCARLVDDYLAAYDNPEQEFDLIEAWVVGPTVRSTVRLESHSAI